MDASVLIPTRGRAASLARCVGLLARQTLDGKSYEVVVGLDGDDPESARAAFDAWTEAGGRGDGLTITTCPRAGYIDVRHRLLAELSGDVYVSLNDDVEPEPGFLAAHVEAQRGAPAVVVGDSRFVDWPDATALDRLLAEAGLAFFYHTMDEDDPERDWGFRHCFGLNFSAPLDTVRAAGGIPAMPMTYGFDDLELGYRLTTGAGLSVRYRPAARAPHRHRYRAPDLLRRERSLGMAAVRYARHAPGFMRAVLGCDILDEQEIGYFRAFVQRESRDAGRIEVNFLRLDDLSASSVSDDLVSTLAQQFILLKRLLFRQGVLDEIEVPIREQAAST